MPGRYQQEDIERQRAEQGERFLKQLQEMFASTRSDLRQEFVPRPELEARMKHQDEMIEGVTRAVEKLTDNVANSHESLPRIYADRIETKAELAELRTEIEKLKTARDADKDKQFGYRYDDLGRIYKGDAGVERGWRVHTQQQGSQVIGWLIGGGIALLTIAINIIVMLAMRGH